MYGRRSEYTPLYSLFMFCLSMFFFWVAGQGWQKESHAIEEAEASMKWPVAIAHIRNSAVATHIVRSKNSSHEEYTCSVLYDYSVKGKRYASTRISFVDAGFHDTKDKTLAYAIVDNFRAGSTARIRYNPTMPGESVLLPGVDVERTTLDSWTYAWWGFAALLLTLGGAFASANSDGNWYEDRFNFNIIAIPACLIILFCSTYFQGAFVRHLVTPSAVVTHFR